jgi:voltage-gated potassium channel Kch
MVIAARRQNSKALILARAIDRAHADRLTELGAVALVPETLETSLQFGGRLLGAFGLTEADVERRIGDMRAAEMNLLSGKAAGE